MGSNHKWRCYKIQLRKFYTAKKKSYSTQNQFINGLKIFYQVHRHTNIIPHDIERPRKEYKLPNVLSVEEVKRIIEHTSNIKHRCLLMLIYSCGLRIGEALDLKLRDLHKDEGLIYIRKAKGRKDRRVPLAKTLIVQSYTFLKGKMVADTAIPVPVKCCSVPQSEPP